MGLLSYFDNEENKPKGLLNTVFSDPETVGNLTLAAGLLQAGGPSTRPISFGQAFGSSYLNAMNAYNSLSKQKRKEALDEMEAVQMRDYRKAQMDQIGLKNTSLKSQQDAIANLRRKMTDDPTYKPTAADLMEIDPEAAFKSMVGGSVDYALDPKVGINPATNKPAYFIQDKRGNTKWLDAGVPANLKLIPGNEYQGAQTFDTRDGTLAPVKPGGRPAPSGVPGADPVPGAAAGSPAAGGYPIDPSQQGDPFAPWNHITSAKEVDQFKARQFEQDNKRLDEIRKQVAQGRAVMTDLNRFGELNRQTETGSWIDQAEKLPTFDANKKEMQAITARVAPNQRVEGSGGTSDRDMGLYLQGLPGIDKTGDVNRNIRLQYEKQLRDAESRARFQETYLVNRGHLSGVDEAYERQQYRQSGKPDGLDVSKLTPEQQAYLRQQNPEAFETGAAAFERTGKKVNQPKTKAIKLDGGGSAFASLGPDGHYYVERGGKRYRVED